MIRAECWRYILDFKFLAKTSREEMRHKETYFVKVYDSSNPEVYGIGECAIFRGLSAEDSEVYPDILNRVCANPQDELPPISSIRFGFETAFRDLNNGARRAIFNSDWLNGKRGIDINGLIWMGDKHTMLTRIDEKIKAGFKVLKLKIGGINFNDELDILSSIRQKFPADCLEIRLDANGSFTSGNVMQRLEDLSVFNIHSIEQPVAAGQYDLSRHVCHNSPIDIALDEELIGCRPITEVQDLISYITPQYVIIKPSLCGGFDFADKLIDYLTRHNIGWWATSALESNIGLNAIAQWVAAKQPTIPQGLGTGELYTNNIPSPLTLKGSQLFYNPNRQWIL